MLRFIVIALLALLSIVPIGFILKKILGFSDDVVSYAWMTLGWIGVSLLLSHVWKRKPDLEACEVAIDDPTMQTAILQAKSEINRLIKGLDKGQDDAFIKFSQEFGGELDHVWGLVHEYRDGDFIVSLVSEPVGGIDESQPARLRIAKEDLIDWMLVDSHGTTQGAYTMLATIKAYQRMYGKIPKRYTKEIEQFVDFN